MFLCFYISIKSLFVIHTKEASVCLGIDHMAQTHGEIRPLIENDYFIPHHVYLLKVSSRLLLSCSCLKASSEKKISEKSITKCHKHLTRAKLHWPFPFRILISPVISLCLWCFVILLWSTQLHYDCKSANNTLNSSLLRPVLCAVATHLRYIILFYCLYHTLYMCITVSTVVESWCCQQQMTVQCTRLKSHRATLICFTSQLFLINDPHIINNTRIISSDFR